jgi:2-C-methyl-D-erythritol 2,4-cyclodiphosphate synthase
MRIGFGYDVHPFVANRPLILGGVPVPHSRGLLGHSDADVLLHALCDALLGAAALGDIGRHFPDNDPAYAGVSSLLLLEQVVGLIHDRGLRIHNIDTTVVAQEPRLAGHVPDMVRTIAATLLVPPESVSIKAKTTERLGFTGRSEGIAAYAVVLLEEADKP